MYDLLKNYIPNDHSRQVTSYYNLDCLFNHDNKIRQVMDLGCGSGKSVEYFRMKNPKIRWIGLDIENSPEAITLTRTDCEFYTFDGIHIPFDNNSFDIVFCNQVFEHVRHPLPLLKKVLELSDLADILLDLLLSLNLTIPLVYGIILHMDFIF